MLINANALSIPLADKSVHTIVTSPPYYGLRDYGTAKWIGGDPNCKHNPQKPDGGERGDRTLPLGRGGVYKTVCSKCGAIRIDEQIGLEQTPDEYISNLVAVFRECKRILRDDGTLWVNIGDSYCGTGNKGEWTDPKYADGRNGQKIAINNKIDGLKSKDLIGIPWMLAFALRADGWYLRQDIIWAKPNPMPESVKDRCTKSHEYVFLLSKSAKYYYDNEAIKEDSVYPNDNRKARVKDTAKDFQRDIGNKLYAGSQTYPTRNKRDVWTVTTKPYKGAHYATYPTELIKPCILAGAPETCCAKCGAPYERVLERKDKRHWTERNDYKSGDKYNFEYAETKHSNEVGRNDAPASYKSPEFIDHGYRPTCDCNAGTSNGIVFDPFVGSGTTVATAIQLGRKGIGIDLSFKYLHENAKERVESAELPLLNFFEQ